MCMPNDISQAQPSPTPNRLAIAAEILAIASMKLRAIGLTQRQITDAYRAASRIKGMR